MTTLSVGTIRTTVEKLRKLNVPPKNGFYTAYVPITPLTEQKFADLWGFGINTKNDWLCVFCFGFDVDVRHPPQAVTPQRSTRGV